MKQKLMIGLLALVLLGVAASAGVLIFSQHKTGLTLSPTTNTPGLIPTPTPTPKLLTWDDPAGFTFQYPEGLIINKHDEDQDNYAHVELTEANHPGRIIVWAKDTSATNLAAWIRSDKSFTGANILDTTLGKQPAKKILLTTGTDKKLIVGTIYDSLLFDIEGTVDDAGYWSKMEDQIVGSFVFKPIDNQAASVGGNGDSGDDAVDEEEVIQ